MKIFALVVIAIFLDSKALLASYCNKELKYHVWFGNYGTDIKCEKLAGNDSKLFHISSYNPVYLQIKSSNMQEIDPKIFENVKSLRILEIVNSTFLFRDNTEIFKRLKRLEQLTIQDSKFCNISETVLQPLEFLIKLKLKNIGINALPKNSLKPLKKLESLELSENKLRRIDSIPICEVPHLRRLILFSNEIDRLDPSSFLCDNFEDSIDFDLNTFKYEVTMPKPIYFNTSNSRSNLLEINLSYNRISVLSTYLAEMTTLRYLNLEANRISILHGYELNDLAGLQNLNLKDNLISKINDTVFSKIRNIRVINLDGNRIIDVVFRNLPILESVNLARNRFDVNNLRRWKKVPDLKSLDLSHNGITALPGDVFKSIIFTEYLNLSCNNLVLDNSSFKYLSNLIELNLSNNSLKELPFQLLSNLTSLKILDLSENNFKAINFSHIFRGQIVLERLNLSYNKIEYLTKEFANPFKNLQLLDLEGNNLKHIELEVISKLPYLKTINVKNNKLPCEFLTELISYLKKKNIVYTSTKEVNITSENVGGIPCTESSKKEISLVDSKPLVNKSVVAAKYSDFKLDSVSDKQSSSISTVFIVLFSILMICSVFGYMYYKYYKRRRYVNDQFELIRQ